MYYDDAKGRYVIEGESESDDEPVPPPPPVSNKPKAPVEGSKKKDDEPLGGAAGLMAAPMNPALSRAKDKRAKRGNVSRYANTFD